MAAPTITPTDTFTRANETPVTGIWTNAGWNGTAGRLQVVSNAVKCAITGFGSQYVAGPFGPNWEAIATVTTKAANGEEQCVLFGGLQNPGNGAAVNGYALEVDIAAGTDQWIILKVTNGAQTALGAAASQEVTANDKIALVRVGNDLEAYIFTAGSWTLVMTRTDPTYTLAGAGGLEMQNLTAVLDDVGFGTTVVGGGGAAAPPALVVPSQAVVRGSYW